MSEKKWKFWPEALLLLVCAAWLLYGISQKEGYHMDELLSFELANAKFNPWIVPTQPQGRLAKFVENEIDGETLSETLGNLKDTVLDVAKNRGGSKLLTYRADVYEEPVWITGEQFWEYITVGDRDAFNYLSVYFNVKDDNHPPLHFMMLHTVSSIFRGRLVPLMGCGINLACVLGIMVFLMRLGQMGAYLLGQKENGRLAGFWAAALYGLSAAALSTTLLIRMYAMLSLFCVALLVIHMEKLYGGRLRVWYPRLNEKGFGTNNKLLILVTVLGFWTQYFFLFYCLILAAVTVVWLWRMGRTKEVWRYVRSMILAAVIGVAGYPFAIGDVFSSGRGVEALSNLSSGFVGYGIRLKAFCGIAFRELGVGTVVILGGICLVMGIWHIVKEKGISARELVCVLTLPVVGYFLLAARMSPYLVDRYIMPLFPLGILLLVLPAVCFVKKPLLWSVVAVTVLLQPIQTIRFENPYLYKGYKEQLQIAEKYSGYPCVCIGEGVGYYENLLEFAAYERTLILTPQEFEQAPEAVKGLDEAVVLVKDGLDTEQIRERMEQVYHMSLTRVLMPEGGVYGDEILLFGAME
ncbi:MAG: hypothetical protein IJ794_16215 [Lachnospiraceae bacterium]|nr:hypothetical protein [Lachnospiraceae bacterium]